MRTAKVCPTCSHYENSKCILYEGQWLSLVNIEPGDSVEVSLQKINDTMSTLSGLQQIIEAQGFLSLQGYTGAQGVQGAQGLLGLQGITGIQGSLGIQGPIGIQGASGAQ
jgi:hypothetical protein